MSKGDVAEIKPRVIGRSIARKEDDGILTGRAKYIADIRLPGMLHVAVLRSPFARARITSVDLSGAASMPGVELTWSGADVLEKCAGIAASMEIDGFVATVQPVLAHDICRYVGEGVAVVVASSRRLAEDALERIVVQFEELPAIAGIEAALADGAPLANETIPGNQFYRGSRVKDDLDPVFAGAAVIADGEFLNGRANAAPMEPRGCIASYEWTNDRMTLWTATQMPSFIRTMTAIFIGFPEQNLEVITPSVGGGFGQKAHLHPEELLVCLLSKELGKPVAWIEDRQENLLAATHAKHQQNRMALACDKDGLFLGLRVSSQTDAGAYNCSPWTSLIESYVGMATVTGVYKFPRLQDESHVVATNKTPIGAYRGVGWTAMQSAREALIDDAARELGLSPFEIRRRNVILERDFPYTTAGGQVVREGSFLQTIDELEKMVDYPAFLERQKAERARGRYLGLGISIFNEIGGMGTRALKYLKMPVTSHDTATVRLDPTGKVTVTTALVSAGQGHLTTFAQIAADAFGVSTNDVIIRAGVTNNSYSYGTWASRAAVIAAGTIGRAAEIVRKRVLQLAAHMLEASAEDLVMENGSVHVAGVPARGLPLAQVVGAAYFADATHPPAFEPAMEATAAFDPSDLVLANGSHAAIVEVDAQTGIVKIERCFAIEDCGQMINPMVVEGQVRGGIGQGVGAALLEELVHDVNGQLQTTTLMDYLLPTSVDVPDIEILHLCTPSDLVPGGIKGMGESAMISAPASIICAVRDALSPFKVRLNQFPLTPDRIVRALAHRETGAGG